MKGGTADDFVSEVGGAHEHREREEGEEGKRGEGEEARANGQKA